MLPEETIQRLFAAGVPGDVRAILERGLAAYDAGDPQRASEILVDLVEFQREDLIQLAHDALGAALERWDER